MSDTPRKASDGFEFLALDHLPFHGLAIAYVPADIGKGYGLIGLRVPYNEGMNLDGDRRATLVVTVMRLAFPDRGPGQRREVAIQCRLMFREDQLPQIDRPDVLHIFQPDKFLARPVQIHQTSIKGCDTDHVIAVFDEGREYLLMLLDLLPLRNLFEKTLPGSCEIIRQPAAVLHGSREFEGYVPVFIPIGLDHLQQLQERGQQGRKMGA